MKLIRSRPWYGEGNSHTIVAAAFLAIAVIAIVDSVVIPFVGFGYIYLIPMTVAAVFLSRWQIVTIAAICTMFAEGFAKLPEGWERYPRVLFMFIAYLLVGFLVRELAVYSRSASRRISELERDFANVREAEQELELLMNSTSVGIIAVTAEGTIVTCNRAAHDIFSVDAGGLIGRSIRAFLPVPLGEGPVECTAADGRKFSARAWTTTFESAGKAMTAVIVEPSVSRRPAFDLQ